MHLTTQNEIEDFDIELTCIDTNVGKNAKLAQFIEGYFEELKLLTRRAGPRSKGLSIWGANYCRHCHVVEYDIWAASKHAQAFKTLVAQKKEWDISCIKCHATGFKSDEVANLPEELQNVQCEACHRFGGKQVKPNSQEHPDQVSQEICLTCHDRKNSPILSIANIGKNPSLK